MPTIETFNGKELPEMETERLILRQRRLSDAEDIFAYAKLAEVSYPAGFPPVATLEDEIAYLRDIYPKNLAEKKIPSGYGITLKGQDRVIGSIDFNNRHADGVMEMGYLLHPDYWGQGIMTEAARALIEVGFDLLQLHKIEIGCYDYNQASRRIAEKLGFSLEATIRDRQDAQGKRCNDLRYGLLRREWEMQISDVSVFIIGAPASGKMTIGQKLEKWTNARLFHNHESIDFALKFMEGFSTEMLKFHQDITLAAMTAFAKQGKNMIGTGVINFDIAEDVQYLQHIQEIFEREQRKVLFIELETTFEERLKRNRTSNRLIHKPLKRHVDISEQEILETSQYVNFNPSVQPEELNLYYKINNTHLSAEEVASFVLEKIKEINSRRSIHDNSY